MSIGDPLYEDEQAKVSTGGPDGIIPKHVAVIMDGNGRWAKARGLPRFAGHKEGVATVVKVVEAAVSYGVEVLTLYTFSTENWKRPKSEIDFILKLPKEFLGIHLPKLMANNVRIEAIGDMDMLPFATRKAIQHAIDRTRHNDGLQLNFALNYGSRQEMLNAMKAVYADLNASKLSLDALDEQQFSKYLYTAGTIEPDLLIRTGGEKRLSNFLLWQLAYTEFWFSDILWPDFTEQDFIIALEAYGQRKRRYGGV